ncbi:TVAZ2 protein, partial [Onychorhynchus coronatus]|nr:TVAZ2 protein [Onychorhynchus coronatus]
FFLPGMAVGRAQVLQDPLTEAIEGTGISINCSLPKVQGTPSVHWYRQFPDQALHHIVTSFTGDKPVLEPAGQLSVSGDRRWSTLWLSRPRSKDAAVYYCALAD